MKSLWKSKTLWANMIAAFAIILQMMIGDEVIPAEAQAGILALINVILRFATKEPIKWIVILCLLPMLAGCSTVDNMAAAYFQYRVDAAMVIDGGWTRNGLIIQIPGQTPAGSLTFGREVGFATITLQPLDDDDSMRYERIDGLRAGVDGMSAEAETITRISNDAQGYLKSE